MCEGEGEKRWMESKDESSSERERGRKSGGNWVTETIMDEGMWTRKGKEVNEIE